MPAPRRSDAKSLRFWRLVVLALGVYILVDKLWLSASDAADATPSASTATSAAEPPSGPRLLSTEEEHAHPHEAIFFLVLAIVVGTCVLHASTFLRGLQQTVVLFVLGCLLSLLMHGMGLQPHLGAVGRSYAMWMSMDPHLLLYALLPPLLAGDAMSIDMVVARKVAGQCLYLAGPGVLVNALLCALFLWVYLPYDWPFLLCATTGAILSATDPVAVVALLKELGASPTLTVQIQGESLLNDGTSIVMYGVAYDMLAGQRYDWGEIVAYLVHTAVYAWLLGLLVGVCFYLWIRAAKDKLEHSSSTVQALLTIACAYTSFLVAEGVFHVSGVLCTVAAALLLADKMWPEVVCHETLHTVWHMLESLGNTVIFFLAGALTGNIMVRIPAMDYLHLVMIYVVLMLLRLTLLLCSRPLLRLLVEDRRPVALADAIVMSWGGLRGAVGLALGIQVSMSRAGGKVDDLDADRVFFYVGGVALLTLVVNALSCPALVRFLELTKPPAARRHLLLRVHAQLERELQMEPRQDVRRAVGGMLRELKQQIEPIQLHPDLQLSGGASGGGAGTVFLSRGLERMRRSICGPRLEPRLHNSGAYLEFARRKAVFDEAPSAVRAQLRPLLPDERLVSLGDRMGRLLVRRSANRDLLRATNESLLALVRSEYWRQVRSGEISSGEANLLLDSVATSLSTSCDEVDDLEVLLQVMDRSQEILIDREQALLSGERRELLQNFCESTGFRMFVFLAIIANSVFIFIEQYLVQDPGHREDLLFFAVETGFTSAFVLEVLLQIGWQRCRYFADSWNLFDLVLVGLGVAGVVTHWMALGATVEHSRTAQTVRFFKVIRAVRLLRLLKSFHVLRAAVLGSMECLAVAARMRRLTLLFAFAKAHAAAQRELLRFLGNSGEPDSAELARCLLQSLSVLYRALQLCAEAGAGLDGQLLHQREICEENIRAAARMEALVNEAFAGGVLSGGEASALKIAMHAYWQSYQRRMRELRQGRTIMFNDGDEFGWQHSEPKLRDEQEHEDGVSTFFSDGSNGDRLAPRAELGQAERKASKASKASKAERKSSKAALSGANALPGESKAERKAHKAELSEANLLPIESKAHKAEFSEASVLPRESKASSSAKASATDLSEIKVLAGVSKAELKRGHHSELSDVKSERKRSNSAAPRAERKESRSRARSLQPVLDDSRAAFQRQSFSKGKALFGDSFDAGHAIDRE